MKLDLENNVKNIKKVIEEKGIKPLIIIMIIGVLLIIISSPSKKVIKKDDNINNDNFISSEDFKEVNTNECPDFSTLSPKQIMKWCKEFDIDPNDYSKQYLVKALTKRWKFKYED